MTKDCKKSLAYKATINELNGLSKDLLGTFKDLIANADTANERLKIASTASVSMMRLTRTMKLLLTIDESLAEQQKQDKESSSERDYMILDDDMLIFRKYFEDRGYVLEKTKGKEVSSD